MLALPRTAITTDIHCVTKWSKFDTQWEGVSIDDFLDSKGIEPPADYVMAFCDGGYTTNLPFEDLAGGKGMVAFRYDGEDLDPGARRPRSAPRAASLLLEVGEVGPRPALHGR